MWMDSAKAEVVGVLTKPDPELNRKNVERIKFAKGLHQRCRWTVEDFAENLKLEDSGICAKTECGTSHVSEAHFKRVFPNKGGSGIRVVANEFITEKECGEIWQQYHAMYNHAPPNKEFARFFLRSWLAERDGKAKINWAKFAHDVCRKQYISWQKDGRVEEALHTKWDELQGIHCPGQVGHGASLCVDRRQGGATSERTSWSEDQSMAVVEMLGDAETDCAGIGPKL